jgi:hypothetical protein
MSSVSILNKLKTKIMLELTLDELASLLIFKTDDGKFYISSFDEEYDENREYYDTFEEIYSIIKKSYKK